MTALVRPAWPEPSAPMVPELHAAALAAPDCETETLALADLTLWSDIAATPTPFFVPGLIPAGEVTLLTGAGGGNKSTFGQQLATCAAAGRQLLGLDVTQGGALYVTAEDSDDRLHWMQEHQCRVLGVSMASLAGKLHLASIRGRLNNELATFEHDGRMVVRETYHLIRATVAATGAKLLVLDNVAHLFAGNENDRGQVTAFVNLLYALARDMGVTVLLIAHRNKAGDSYSGSTAWLNAVRSQLLIERPEDGHDPDARVLTVGKANYARPDQQIAFRWHDFALVRDEDLPADRLAELHAVAATGGENEAFLACLDARTKDGLIVSPNVSPNYAPSQFEAMPSAKGIGKERLKRAMERLLSIGAIEVYDHENKGKGRSVKALRRAAGSLPGRDPERFPHTVPERPRTVLPDAPPHTPPYYVREGAAPDGPPRPLPNGGEPDLSRVVFPDDDTGWSTGWGEGP